MYNFGEAVLFTLFYVCISFVSATGNEKCYALLNTGAKMPLVGYGTWLALDNELEKALETALETGYRHIDTATVYNNEHVIGKVLNRWLSSNKLKREDIFITTKLPSFGNTPEGVERFLNESLKKLQLDYVDMYLVHSPVGFPETGGVDADGNILLDATTDHLAIWKQMEAQYDAGKAKAIGISNFNETQIRRIISNARIAPSNLQIELHIHLQQKPLVEFCKKNNIVVTSYATLGSPGTFTSFMKRTNIPNLMQNEVIVSTAKKYNKSPAQILLRFVMQQGIVVIPKSTSLKRMKENFEITNFVLREEDMKIISNLDKGEKGRLLILKDVFKGVDKHPEYPY